MYIHSYVVTFPHAPQRPRNPPQRTTTTPLGRAPDAGGSRGDCVRDCAIEAADLVSNGFYFSDRICRISHYAVKLHFLLYLLFPAVYKASSPCEPAVYFSLGASPLPACLIAVPGSHQLGVSWSAVVLCEQMLPAAQIPPRVKRAPRAPVPPTALSGLPVGLFWSPHLLRDWVMATLRTTRHCSRPGSRSMAQQRTLKR